MEWSRINKKLLEYFRFNCIPLYTTKNTAHSGTFPCFRLVPYLCSSGRLPLLCVFSFSRPSAVFLRNTSCMYLSIAIQLFVSISCTTLRERVYKMSFVSYFTLICVCSLFSLLSSLRLYMCQVFHVFMILSLGSACFKSVVLLVSWNSCPLFLVCAARLHYFIYLSFYTQISVLYNDFLLFFVFPARNT